MTIELAKYAPPVGPSEPTRIDPSAPWPFKIEDRVPNGIRVVNSLSGHTNKSQLRRFHEARRNEGGE